ncbi:hypothetical protein MTBPR1_10580 [Candidatus Terasakiella magnetica]|uniref:Hemerythrin-like domain-containing protein n=1 Tax=Candidatus Terasakiella magnetica TaxID=1867952 RepID=A0A1C3RDG0_9PROT|nr:hemerythrin family protein [Candidatus Terasakiella magnetica]SCA55333.1 hypothetical protein MTBPR1_10580 [Candidatus Terasakiella magnetica]
MAQDFDFTPYKIGIPLVDADHLSLFNEVFKLRTAIDENQPAENMTESIHFLYQYVSSHFAREEQLMKEKGYPKFAEHKAIHHHLKKVVYAVRKIFEEDPDKIDREKLNDFLQNWLIDHIMNVDKHIEPYVNGPYGQGIMAQQETLDESINDDVELVEVRVMVPKSQAEVIKRCAYILQNSTPEANDLEELAISAAGMTKEEAEELAASVLVGG